MIDFIEELAKEFKSSIPDKELGEKLTIEFKNVLKGVSKNFKDSNYEDSEIKNILRKISDEWINLEVEEKQRRLLSDDNFENIMKISQQAVSQKLMNIEKKWKQCK